MAILTTSLVQHRWSLGITYTLSLVEQLLMLSLPSLIGLAINELLVNRYEGLIWFTSIWLLLTGMVVGRKMYDTRIFMSIYQQVALAVIQQQKASGTNASKLMARSVLLRQIIDFFERDIPNIFAMSVAFFGSLVMLTLFDGYITLVALLMLIPVLSLNAALWKPITRLNRGLNNNLERQVHVLEKGGLSRITQHFAILRFLQVKTSDLEARIGGLIELFVIAATAYVFIYTAGLPAIEAGTIFAVVTYFWNFQESLDNLPNLLQSISKVHDILQRIRDI